MNGVILNGKVYVLKTDGKPYPCAKCALMSKSCSRLCTLFSNEIGHDENMLYFASVRNTISKDINLWCMKHKNICKYTLFALLFILILLISYTCTTKKNAPNRKRITHDTFLTERRTINGHDYIIIEGRNGVNIIHAVDCEIKDVNKISEDYE